MKKINFADPYIGSLEKKLLIDAYNSKWISLGKYNIKLEKESKKLFNRKYALGVSNGTIAINLAAIALGLERGDEVIVPSLCYISPIHVLKSLGIKTKVCKIDNHNLQINLEDLENKISKKTKAIILIYNFGNLPNLLKINKISKKFKIPIIEDFSEAIFSKFEKINAGSIGEISTASLHATKTITSGEGGIVVTDNKKLFDKMKKIREHGYYNKSIPYTYEMIGFNFKISNLLAAIGYGQLKKNRKIINKKKQLLKIYLNNLKNYHQNIHGLFDKKETPVMWSLPFITKNITERDKLIKYLKINKIQTRPSFKMIYNYKHLKINKLKEKNISEKIVLLPIHPALSKNNVMFICRTINNFYEQR